MKNIIKYAITSFIVMVFVACGGENSFDGENGLPGGGTNSKSIDASINEIFSKVILKDAKSAFTQAQNLEKSIQTLNANTSETNLLQAQAEFKKLSLAYKKVESVYVAGYNNDAMRDIAEFYLEQYIKSSKSQDIAGDLDRVFSGESSLVANSLKGITALEYTLFGNAESISSLSAKMNSRRLSSAMTMISKISGHLEEVEVYYDKTSTFKSDGDESVSVLLNVLSQQSFNLRELRIGEAAGLTTKFKNNPSSERLEYHRSLNSLEAIKEILNTFKTIMETGLKDIAVQGSANPEADAISSAINDALRICKEYPSTLESGLTDSRTVELYETTRTIQNNITALINGLNFKQDIIDADGD